MMTTNLAIVYDFTNPTLDFAAQELERFLQRTADFSAWRFRLSIDPALTPFAFAVSVQDREVVLRGHGVRETLHAVYTLLEALGWVFEITGPRQARRASPAELNGLTIHVQPAVNWRGIRQHINFPMDISSYPLDEALDYIHNLARLRLNHITFHSYPDQWYEVALSSGPMLAGNYFYGQRHDLPDHPIRSVIRNRETFCIPEIEPYCDDPHENSVRAMNWLRILMREAHRVGLRVQFSFELREQHLEDSLRTVDAILTAYPMIDVLEIITQESGEWGHAASPDDLRRIARQSFGDAALNDPAISAHLSDGQKDLDRLMTEIGHAIQVFNALRTRNTRLPALALGVYCTVRSDHAVILALLQRFVPDGISYALLFDHGNRAVARNLRDLAMPRADWERSLVYSWIEFDGTIYLLQNALEGVHRLIALAREVMDGAPVNAIAFNHWRTAENQTTARYAAQAMLLGDLTPAAFYAQYAASYGIASADDYAAAMTLIDEADTQARDELPNVGFCFVGCWGTSGLGYYGIFRSDRLQAVRAKYERTRDMLTACSQDATADGRGYLALLVNRARSTAIFLRGVEEAVKLQAVCADRSPDALNDDEREQVRAICDRALALMEDYMALHAQMIVDRGCEGTLISFYYTPPAVLKRIRAEYGGTGETVQVAQSSDAPPSPIWAGE